MPLQAIGCKIGALSILLAVTTGGPCHAQHLYPNRLVKIVVPAPAGAGVDFIARLVAEGLAQRWNQNVIVENRPGGSGVVATEQVARSVPDGYTLEVMGLDVAINPVVFKRDPADPVRNLVPIAALVTSTQIIAAHPSTGIRTVSDLVAKARAEGGRLSFGSCNAGSPGEIIGEMFKARAAVQILHVAYKGCSPAVNDAIGGHIPLVIGGAGAVAAQVKGGLLTGVAVASDQRDPQLPDVPTLAEAGYSGISITNWFSLFGPPGLPIDITEKISVDLAAIYSEDAFRAKILARTLKPSLTTPAELRKLIDTEVPHLAGVLDKLSSGTP